MKKTLFAAFILLVTTSQTLLATPERDIQARKEAIRKEVFRNISFPDFITANSEDNKVALLVKTDENGCLNVLKANGTNSRLNNYATRQLHEMKLRSAEANTPPFVLVLRFQIEE